MGDPFKSHTVLFTYGHGMPCPYLPKRTQSPHPRHLAVPGIPLIVQNEPNLPYRWRLAGFPILHCAKRTQSWHVIPHLFSAVCLPNKELVRGNESNCTSRPNHV